MLRGFHQRTKEVHPPSVVIAVENIQKAMQKVRDAGGTILGGQTAGEPDIPGVGLLCSFIDTEVNQVSMLQAKR